MPVKFVLSFHCASCLTMVLCHPFWNAYWLVCLLTLETVDLSQLPVTGTTLNMTSAVVDSISRLERLYIK